MHECQEGFVGIQYHGPAAEPGTSVFARKELVAVAMAKVEAEERGSKMEQKWCPGLRGRGERKRRYREETGTLKALVPPITLDQVKSRDATGRGSIHQAMPTDPQAIPAVRW